MRSDHLHTCCAIDAEVYTYQALIRDTLANEAEREKLAAHSELDVSERLLLLLPIAKRYRQIVDKMKGLELG